MKRLIQDIEYCPTAADAEGADACIVMTEWQEFMSLMRSSTG